MLMHVNALWIFIKSLNRPRMIHTKIHALSKSMSCMGLGWEVMYANVLYSAIMCRSPVFAYTPLRCMIVVFKNFDHHNRSTTENYSYTGSWNPIATLVPNHRRNQQCLYILRCWSVCLCCNDISDTRYNLLNFVGVPGHGLDLDPICQCLAGK